MSGVITSVDGSTLLIRLDRPEVRNAIDGEVADGLLRAVHALDEDPHLLVGVIYGAGSDFCAGIDLHAFQTEGLPKALLTFLQRGSCKPLVAAVEGNALAGGLEIALTCDIIVASRAAQFGLPEVSVGLVACGGGLFRLPDRISAGAAARIALTGDRIGALEAVELGLVDELSEPGQAVTRAQMLATRISRNSPAAVLATKEISHATRGQTEAESWKLQQPVMERILKSDDGREGSTAFMERRPAAWRRLQ